MFDASVIITTYNKLDALKLTLEGFKRQSVSGFEVIIADDGSTDETSDYFSKNAGSYPFELNRIWHEDKGFRKSIILNKAIARARSKYLIFNDRDCIPHKEFVNAHLSLRERGCFVIGRSTMMSEKVSNKIDAAYIENGNLDGINLCVISDFIFGKTKFGEFSVYLKSDFMFELVTRFRKRKHYDNELGFYNRRLYGGNFSAWKDDLSKVNGFDEGFIGWGHEDSELHHRLLHAGLRPIPAMNRAVNFHYYHDRSHAVISDENNARLKRTLESDIIRCEKGLDQYLKDEV